MKGSTPKQPYVTGMFPATEQALNDPATTYALAVYMDAYVASLVTFRCWNDALFVATFDRTSGRYWRILCHHYYRGDGRELSYELDNHEQQWCEQQMLATIARCKELHDAGTVTTWREIRRSVMPLFVAFQTRRVRRSNEIQEFLGLT